MKTIRVTPFAQTGFDGFGRIVIEVDGAKLPELEALAREIEAFLKCPRCGGDGFDANYARGHSYGNCLDCKGSGWKSRTP